MLGNYIASLIYAFILSGVGFSTIFVVAVFYTQVRYKNSSESDKKLDQIITPFKKITIVAGLVISVFVYNDIPKEPPRTSQTSQTPTKSTTTISIPKSQNITVYVTSTGKKFHQEGCHYLKSESELSLSDALNKGYKPCSYCWNN